MLRCFQCFNRDSYHHERHRTVHHIYTTPFLLGQAPQQQEENSVIIFCVIIKTAPNLPANEATNCATAATQPHVKSDPCESQSQQPRSHKLQYCQPCKNDIFDHFYTIGKADG